LAPRIVKTDNVLRYLAAYSDSVKNIIIRERRGKMNRTDELFFEIIETYQRHARAVKNAKYQKTREMAEMIIDVDISSMWFLTQRIPDTK
jgi:hypothetical protein